MCVVSLLQHSQALNTHVFFSFPLLISHRQGARTLRYTLPVGRYVGCDESGLSFTGLSGEEEQRPPGGVREGGRLVENGARNVKWESKDFPKQARPGGKEAYEGCVLDLLKLYS